jgi:fluoride exporter
MPAIPAGPGGELARLGGDRPGTGPLDQPVARTDPIGTDLVGADPAGRAAAGPDAQWRTLAVIAVGGAAGALARYRLSTAFPHPPGAFDWATLGVNVSGCALIGALMVAITEIWPAHRLVRPFLVVGVLGGFTTFSTYIVDIQRSLDAGAAASALAYLAVTLAAALAAVWAGITGMRVLARRVRPPGPSPSAPSPGGGGGRGPLRCPEHLFHLRLRDGAAGWGRGALGRGQRVWMSGKQAGSAWRQDNLGCAHADR